MKGNWVCKTWALRPNFYIGDLGFDGDDDVEYPPRILRWPK